MISTVGGGCPTPAIMALFPNPTPGTWDGIQVQTGTLEDVFLSLTGRQYRA